MPPRKLPPNEELIKMSRSGLTHQEIADRVSEQIGEPVSRVSVTLALQRAGEERRTPRYDDEIPWTVLTEHLNEWPLRMLRLLGRQRSGVALNDKEAAQLERWLKMLHEDNAVVAYSPTSTPGFYYVLANESSDEPDGIPIRPRILSTEEVMAAMQ